MKKKHSVFFGFSVVMTAAICTLAGCGNPANTNNGGDDPGHIHDWVAVKNHPNEPRIEVLAWSKWTETRAADESPDGIDGEARRFAIRARKVMDVIYECKKCGEKKTEPVPLGDEFAYDDGVPVYDQVGLYGEKIIPAGKVLDPDSVCDDEPRFKWKGGNGGPVPGPDPEGLNFPTDARYAAPTTAVNPLGILNNGGFSGGVYVQTNSDNAAINIALILQGISDNAAAIQGFANWVVAYSENGDGKTFFSNLSTAQNAIRTSVEESTLSGSFTVAKSQVNAILGELGITSGGSADIDKLFDGYAAGHYLVTRDWRSADGVGAGGGHVLNDNADQANGKIEAFRWARDKAGLIDVSGKENGRQVTIPHTEDFWYSITQIENQLVAVVAGNLATAWGIGPAPDALTALVRALIVQCGQDMEGLDAIVEDIRLNTALSNAFNYSYVDDWRVVVPEPTYP